MENKEIFTYQGVDVAAEVMSRMDHGTTPGHHREDTLFRDEAGRYYLQRQAHHHRRNSSPNWAREHAEETGYRCLVHCISLNAAILWSTREGCNGDPWRLYLDASNLLTANRSVSEPPPFGFDTWAEYRQQHSSMTAVATTVTPPDTEEVMVAGRRFTFHYPAGKRSGSQVQMTLSDEQLSKAERLAGHFNLEPVAFLRAVGEHTLPNQPRNFAEEDKMEEQLKAEHIAFACFDEAMQRRLERAAHARGMIVNELIADAVGRDVDAAEEFMLVHPQTGELLMDDIDDLYLQIQRKEVAPPARYENDPRFRGIFERQELVEPATTSGTRHLTDGSMVVTLHLKPEPARLVRTAATLNEQDVLTEVYGHVQSCVLGRLARTTADQDEMSAIFEDNAPVEEEEAQEPGIIVNLTEASTGKPYATVDLDGEETAFIKGWGRAQGLDFEAAFNGVVKLGLGIWEKERGKTPTFPEHVASTRYGVSQSTLEAARRYAAKHGRTVDEFIVDALEMAADDDPAREPGASTTHAFADGSMDVTLHLKSTPAMWARNQAGRANQTVAKWIYEAMARRITANFANNHPVAKTLERMFAEQAPAEGEKRRYEAAHTLTLELTAKQYRMLRQSARHDRQTVEEFAMWELRSSATSTLAQCYDHDEDEANRAWDEPASWSTVPTVYLVSRSTMETAAHYAAQLGGTVDEMIVNALERVKEETHAKWAGKHHVTFSVWLTDEQMRGKFNLVASMPPGSEKDLYFSATVPKEAAPLLTVDGEKVELFAEALQRAASLRAIALPNQTSDSEGLCVHLDDEAADIVRRYLTVAPSDYSAGDIASGCVINLLEMALANQAEAKRMKELDGDEYHDGEWGTAEELFDDAKERRLTKKTKDEQTVKPAPAGEPNDHALETVRAVVVELDERALELARAYSEHKIGDIVNGALHFCLEAQTIILDGPTLQEAIDEVAGRRLGLDNWMPEEQLKGASTARCGAKPNPADVALLAASAPEAVEPTPTTPEDDEHLPEEEHIDEPGDGTATPDGKEAQ